MTQNAGQDKPNGMGRVMIVLTWVLTIALFTYLFNDILIERFNPNQDPKSVVGPAGEREVILARNAQGHYVANGFINGRRVTFLVDTGATDVAIPESLADQLGLPRMRGGFGQTANGTVAVWGTQLDSVQLGSLRLRDVRASIMPSMGDDVPVLLGMSFLKQLELVQRDGELTLRQLRDAG